MTQMPFIFALLLSLNIVSIIVFLRGPGFLLHDDVNSIVVIRSEAWQSQPYWLLSPRFLHYGRNDGTVCRGY